MDLARVIHREPIRPAAVDLLGGQVVYSQPGAPRIVVTSADPVPVDGVRLDGWWADRCVVDLYGVGSDAGATVRIRLLACNLDYPTQAVTLVNRSIIVAAGSKTAPQNLTFCVASGWLARWWVLTAQLDAGAECEFAARYTLDRARAGLYTAFGDGTAP